MALETLPPRVLVLTGPTASGKSEMAVALAESLGAEIVGADSRQVYRLMEIGTAKPPASLRARVAHHLIDVVDPDADYDVAAWRADALSALADLHRRGRLAIVCGGTGLYLRSLEKGLFAGPAADPALRRRLVEEEGAAPGLLHARLARVDAPAAARIHHNDLMRVVRALEVFEATGRPLSAWLAEHGLTERLFTTLTLELEIPRDELDSRIQARSRAMVDAGLVEELGALYARGYAPTTRAFDAIGYREAGLCLAGSLPRATLADAIARATMQYAKRQRTWLRGQARTIKIDGAGTEAALRLARGFFS